MGHSLVGSGGRDLAGVRGGEQAAQEVEARVPPALRRQDVHGQHGEVVRPVHLVRALHPLLTRLLQEALQVLLLTRRGSGAVGHAVIHTEKERDTHKQTDTHTKTQTHRRRQDTDTETQTSIMKSHNVPAYFWYILFCHPCPSQTRKTARQRSAESPTLDIGNA